MNEVLKTIAERSSIRAYTQEQLTEEEIRALLTAGLQAPTARNMREIHISVLKGSHPVLAEIEQEKRRLAASGADEKAKAAIQNNPNNFYYGAPVVLMLSADKDFYWSKLDAGICAENISLAAQSMGLGSLIIGIIRGAMEGERKEEFSKICRFPENYEFAIAVAVGHKDTEKAPHEIDMEKSVSFAD